MKSWSTSKGSVIYPIASQRSNAYLVVTEHATVIVDTGISSVLTQLKKQVMRCYEPCTHVSALILTHTHYDHCQNAQLISRQFSCPVIMGQGEAEFVPGGYTPLPRGTTKLFRLLSSVGNRVGGRLFGYAPFFPEVMIAADGIITQLKLDIILTPGHSAGSISVIVDNEVALVGDTLFGLFKGHVFPPFADDVDELILSWNKLLHTSCHTFLPGHGAAIDRDTLEREYERYRRR